MGVPATDEQIMSVMTLGCEWCGRGAFVLAAGIAAAISFLGAVAVAS